MRLLIFSYLLLTSLLFQGCSDNYISQINNDSILLEKKECLNLIVFPPNDSMQKQFEELYKFTKSCDLNLVVSYKDSIVCNSNQNPNKKALGMAKSYLRIEVKRGSILYYSYYKDLAENIENQDIEDGFKTMSDALSFYPSTK